MQFRYVSGLINCESCKETGEEPQTPKEEALPDRGYRFPLQGLGSAPRYPLCWEVPFPAPSPDQSQKASASPRRIIETLEWNLTFKYFSIPFRVIACSNSIVLSSHEWQKGKC